MMFLLLSKSDERVDNTEHDWDHIIDSLEKERMKNENK